jgi:hypothetical protein
MATPWHVTIVQDAIGYRFRKESLITRALTAAGADPSNHEGNRQMAQCGDAYLHFLVVHDGYKKGARRGEYWLVT